MTKGQFHWYFDGQVTNYYREGVFYLNKDMTQLTLKPLTEDFKTYREKIETSFSGYLVNQEMIFEAPKETPKVHYSDYINLLKSKDVSKLQANSWIFEGLSKFLDGHEQVPKLTYATYPRSGNSFFRKYFETITGLSTGNDIECKYLVNLALQLQGFKG